MVEISAHPSEAGTPYPFEPGSPLCAVHEYGTPQVHDSTPPERPITPARLSSLIFDVVTSKRAIKTGYVRQPGGIYAAQCDTVAAHGYAVTVLSVTLAMQVSAALRERFGIALNIEDVALMAIFHNHEAVRSGDSTSTSLNDHCKPCSREGEELQANLQGLAGEQKILTLLNDYCCYSTVESLLVHMAEDFESFEKGLHCAAGSRQNVQHVLAVMFESISIYRRGRNTNAHLNMVADFLVESVLLPGAWMIADTYDLPETLTERALSI